MLRKVLGSEHRRVIDADGAGRAGSAGRAGAAGRAGGACRRGVVAFFIVASLAACQSVQTTQRGVVGVDRPQQMSLLVSEQELRQGAVQAYREELAKERGKGALNADIGLTGRVRAITSRLIAVTGAFRADAPGWPWEVNVVRSDSINAWVMPGGKVVVYTGLVEKLRLTDDEIAAVVGHEISHALREHARERASQQITAGLVLQGGAAVLGAGPASVDLGKLVYQLTFGLPNGRVHESEADRIGVELAARAGYDPRAAVTLWQKMARTGSGGGPEWLSTHPSAETRIRDLQVYSARVMPLYEQAARRR